MNGYPLNVNSRTTVYGQLLLYKAMCQSLRCAFLKVLTDSHWITYNLSICNLKHCSNKCILVCKSYNVMAQRQGMACWMSSSTRLLNTASPSVKGLIQSCASVNHGVWCKTLCYTEHVVLLIWWGKVTMKESPETISNGILSHKVVGPPLPQHLCKDMILQL